MQNLVVEVQGVLMRFLNIMSCHVASKSEHLSSNRIRTGYATEFTAIMVVLSLLSYLSLSSHPKFIFERFKMGFGYLFLAIWAVTGGGKAKTRYNGKRAVKSS
jgi:hypothetical protein